MNVRRNLLEHVRNGDRLCNDAALALADCNDLGALSEIASAIRDRGHGDIVSYSRKVFIPLTKLCRDFCHYCTFAHPPRRGEHSYLHPEEVVAIARAGAKLECKEALFTLGDKPELRYRAAREELALLGYDTTISYLAAMAALVTKETGLLSHVNPGVMTAGDIAVLRPAAVSQGLMLESSADRLTRRGAPHFGSPDKVPRVRLETIRAAGKAMVPFTSGILIGIGETRRERIEALLDLRDLHEQYGHLQEIIIQNFRAKAGTRMESHVEPGFEELAWTVAVSRIVFGADMSIQVPPNLQSASLNQLVAAGISDWGGVSPLTVDHVNPERPWPDLAALERQTAQAGKVLVERLAVYPAYVRRQDQWVAPSLRPGVTRMADGEGFARACTWMPGARNSPPPMPALGPRRGPLTEILERAGRGIGPTIEELIALFAARGESFREVCGAANELRARTRGEVVSYVVTRNINYTNVCLYHCTFCAFSKGKTHESLRGRPYDLTLDEIVRRSREAFARGAVEVCLQGGIHPDYTGETYLGICRAIKKAIPALHIHAFSPLEIVHGARTLGCSVPEFLTELKAAGLGSLPGTAAEILDDEVRAIICPDKVTSAQWLGVIEAAHRIGLRTTSTIMFGHVDSPRHWATHLLELRRLQERTGGFTEFVPLPFVPMEAPMQLRGKSRLGPTYREAALMHAVARLALHPLIPNIQTSWVKMGPDGAVACLEAGANDLGGTLMNESITRAAGAVHGQEMPPEKMEAMIRSIGRAPRQRTTLYEDAHSDRVAASFSAAPLSPVANTPVSGSRPQAFTRRLYSVEVLPDER